MRSSGATFATTRFWFGRRRDRRADRGDLAALDQDFATRDHAVADGVEVGAGEHHRFFGRVRAACDRREHRHEKDLHQWTSCAEQVLTGSLS